jgi:hypothetical protein
MYVSSITVLLIPYAKHPVTVRHAKQRSRM